MVEKVDLSSVHSRVGPRALSAGESSFLSPAEILRTLPPRAPLSRGRRSGRSPIAPSSLRVPRDVHTRPVATRRRQGVPNVTFRPSAPRKRSRWLGLLVLSLAITGFTATTAMAAAPDFTFLADDGLANDEPGQKDLTAQASAY